MLSKFGFFVFVWVKSSSSSLFVTSQEYYPSSNTIRKQQQQEQHHHDTNNRIIVRKLQFDDNSITYGLLEDTVVTRNDVKEYADLALDLRDIRILSSTLYNNNSITSRIDGMYNDGLNSYLTGRRFSIKKMNDDLVHTMNNNTSNSNDLLLPSTIVTPIYLFQVYGLSLMEYGSGNNNGAITNMNKVANYGYDIIDKLIKSKNIVSISYIPDAILMNTFWMYSIHLLYQGLYTCKQYTNADNPNYINGNGNSKLHFFGMDEFIALYIGTDQKVGTNDGHSLYAWVQEISTYFKTTSSAESESPVNTNIKLLYEEGAAVLALPNACTPSSSSSTSSSSSSYPSYTEKALWNVIVRIIKQMMIPLFQYTIYNLIQQNNDLLKLYSKALIPQLVRCRPSTYKRLYNTLLVHSNIDYSQTSDILYDLKDIFESCFGISCTDIGDFGIPTNGTTTTIHNPCSTKESPTSSDVLLPVSEQLPVLAGYTAGTPVKMISMIDLDIYQMKKLIQLGSYDYSRYIYELGYNVPKQLPSNSPEDENYDEYGTFDLISLQQIASEGSMKTAKENKYYAAYWDYYNERDYINKQILSGFDTSSTNYYMKTNDQRSALISTMLSTQVLLLHLVSLLENTVIACNNDDTSTNINNNNNAYGSNGELDSITLYDVTHPLDEAAALIIGSMEGDGRGGSTDFNDGQLLFGLANKRAFQFQRENDLNYAIVNSELLDELYAARGQLSLLACTELGHKVDHILRLLHVGIMQTIIYVAVQIADGSSTSSGSTPVITDDNTDLVVRGHVMASALLPMMDAYNKEKATILSKNMVNEKGTLVDPPQKIADVLADYLEHSLGLSCKYLGTYGSVKPCLNVVGGKSSAVSYSSSSMYYTVITVTMLVIGTTTYII